MISVRLLFVSLVASGAMLTGCEREVSYTEEVQPILFASCLSCHDTDSEGYLNSGFSLNSYEAVMKGTKFGAVVIPGSSESSSLYLVIAHKTAPEIHMPPHTDNALAEGRGFSLSDKQIETIKLWIDQGATDN